MSWVNHPAAHTPNLDRLAERGVGFANNYCNSPQCVPSRASMVSGFHNHRIGAWNNFKGLEPDDPTIFTDAESAGYRPVFIGRNDYRSGAHSIGARLLAWLRSTGMDLPEKPRPQAVLYEDAGRRVRDGCWKTVDQGEDFLLNESRLKRELPISSLYSGSGTVSFKHDAYRRFYAEGRELEVRCLCRLPAAAF